MAIWTEPENLSDPLSGLLERLCLPGWSSGVAWLGEDWRIDAPPSLIAFYVLLRGRPELARSGASSVACAEGDVLLLAHGTDHRLTSGSSRDALSLLDLPDRGLSPDAADDNAAFIYGFCEASPTGRDILRDCLPPLVHLRAKDNDKCESLDAQTALVVKETAERQPGWQIAVSRAVELFLLHTIRWELNAASPWQGNGKPNDVRYLTAFNDAHLGPAMRLMHEQPGRAWTVPLLARQAGISKSAFSERFRQAVGQPPLQYLTEYRMHKACELLRSSKVGIKQISGLVGYESASSFTNTFKRWIGCTPAEYRKAGRKAIS